MILVDENIYDFLCKVEKKKLLYDLWISEKLEIQLDKIYATKFDSLSIVKEKKKINSCNRHRYNLWMRTKL